MLGPILEMTPISGRGPRPSLFGFSVEQARGFHPTLSGRTSLGQAPADWYRRAKEAVAKHEHLVGRTYRVADAASKNGILVSIGSASMDGSPAQIYAQVKSDIANEVEAYIPPNVNAYEVPFRTERVQALEAANRRVEGSVANAEAAHGISPDAEVISPAGAVVEQAQSPSWLLPAVIVGAIGVAAVVTVLSGGKL